MATYFVDISGTFTMQQLSVAVQTEENLGTSWFVDSKIATNKHGAVVNHCEFDEDKTRPMPSKTELVAAGAAAPAGKKKFWTGKMLVQNTVMDGDGYR